MRIKYDHYGQRIKIEIYYSNGKLLYLCDKLDDDFFLIKEFSKKGSLLKETRKNTNFVNKINETKLYILGF